MNHFYEQIRQTISIEDVASSYTSLKRVGKELAGLCPIHSDSKPSFFVNPDKKTWYCFGCGQGGDVIKLVSLVEDISYHEAALRLAKEYDIPIQAQDTLTHFDILRAVVSKCYTCAKNSEKAAEYLKSRGFKNPLEVITRYGIGFFEPHRVSSAVCNRLNLSLGELTNVLGTKSIRVWHDRIIFAVIEKRGSVVHGIVGRSISEPTSVPKYMNSSFSKQKFMYGLVVAREHIAKTQKVYVVEGTFDALAMWENGYKNTVAVLGSGGLSTQHVSKLVKTGAQQFVLCFDSDSAGYKALVSSIRSLLYVVPPEQIACAILPDGTDPHDLLMNRQTDVGIYTLSVYDAVKRLADLNVYGARYLFRTLRKRQATTIRTSRSIAGFHEDVETVLDLFALAVLIATRPSYMNTAFNTALEHLPVWLHDTVESARAKGKDGCKSIEDLASVIEGLLNIPSHKSKNVSIEKAVDTVVSTSMCISKDEAEMFIRLIGGIDRIEGRAKRVLCEIQSSYYTSYMLQKNKLSDDIEAEDCGHMIKCIMENTSLPMLIKHSRR